MTSIRNYIFVVLFLFVASVPGWSQKILSHSRLTSDGYNFWIGTPAEHPTIRVLPHDLLPPPQPADSTLMADSLRTEAGTLFQEAMPTADHLATAEVLPTDSASFLPTDSTTLLPADSLKPLIIFLHGQSLCGRDLDRVLRYGTIDAIRRGRSLDAYVIAPQNPGGSWNPDKVMAIADWMISEYPIDTTRIYALGMSLGGYGTISLAGTYPDRIAAAMALCGGSNLKDNSRLCELPLWIAHGTADRAIPISCSEQIVKQMEAKGGTDRLIFTKLKGSNHGILARIFYMEKVYRWLFSHSLTDENRPVNRDYDLTTSDLSYAYSDLHYHDLARVPIIRQKATSSSKGKGSGTAAAKEEADGSGAQYYAIRKGDTLSSIARKHGTTVKRLCQLNNINENKILQIGRKLRVK